MNGLQQLQQIFAPSGVVLDPVNLLLNMVLAALLAGILARLYARWGSSLSNRSSFGRNFILLSMTTALIITVVKSSLALSLGLVGALSIVRFRSAIKEPEELAYLFLCIAIGLGFGADQRGATILAFLLIAGLIAGRGWWRNRAQSTENLFLTVSSPNPGGLELDDVVRAVTDNCLAATLRRFDEGPDALEASFLVAFTDYEELERTKRSLRGLSDSVQVSFVDQRGIL
jgi:hypothetical protein